MADRNFSSAYAEGTRSRPLFLSRMMVDKPEVCVFCAGQQIVPMTISTW
jgi:hypothetical protein